MARAPFSRRSAWVAVLAVGLFGALLTGCADSSDDADGRTAQPTHASASTVEYLPGLDADLHPPGIDPPGPVPVVLLVPGGSWQTADRTGLAPLADALAAAGMFVVNATYATEAGVARFPDPVGDVLCAARFAAERAQAAGYSPGPLVVIGHSAGGHLAALAALAGDAEQTRECPYPAAAIDGLVGLAGVYDPTSFPFQPLVDFFGGLPAEDPEAWASGDPVAITAAGNAPDGLEVLLLHGARDFDVPVTQAEAFAAALEAAEVPVQFDRVPGADHGDIYTGDVAAEPLIAWIAQL